MSASDLPDADYLVLASRLIPGLDGGYTVASLGRARLLEAAGAQNVRLLTVDPGAPEVHLAHREEFVRRGDAASADRFRNLFDDALADPGWLRAAAVPGDATPGIEYRVIADSAGVEVLSLPVIAGNPDWHLTDAAVLVHGAGVLRGFGGLYRAWLDHLVAQSRQADADRTVVVICEARQLGELIAGWGDARTRVVHTIHNSHLEPPYDDPAGPVNGLWSRWFVAAAQFDAVLWPTATQRADAEGRFGAHPGAAVVPNPVEPVDEPQLVRAGHRVVMLNRLAAQKRVDRAIRAWAQVVEAVPDAVLDVYGDGPLRAELEALIAEFGLGASVTLHGHIDDRDAVFADAALLLVSTAYEGQGLSIAEALVRGLPVVSFDVRYGPRDTIGDGGVLVPPADVTALADAVIALLRDDQARADLSVRAVEAGRALAPDAVIPALVAAIRGAVERPRE